MHIYYAFHNHIYTFSSVPLKYALFARHISFSLFMLINFNIIHTCISIHNTKAYQVLSDSHKYFHLPAIFFFHVCDTFCILWLKDLFQGITFHMHVCLHVYICVHMHIHSCRSAYIHLSIHTHIHTYIQIYIQIHVCMSKYMHIFMYRLMHVCLHTNMHTHTYMHAHVNTQ